MSAHLRKYDSDVGDKTMFWMDIAPMQATGDIFALIFLGGRQQWYKLAPANIPTS
jgi:hypothetical protein